MHNDILFDSFFLGGLECSAHRLRSGKRLDLLSATGHKRFAAQDFERLRGSASAPREAGCAGTKWKKWGI